MEIKNNTIIIKNLESFNIKQILECGQIFRFYQQGDKYCVFSLDKTCEVTTFADRVEIYSSDIDYFVNFFDLTRNYETIKKELINLPYMQDAINFGGGIRILNQNNFEMIISFIISSNNRIPRIKAIIERLCAKLGKNCGNYYAFPTLKQLSVADEAFFTEIGAGYRAKYLYQTCKKLIEGFDINVVNEMTGEQANKYLQNLCGVGSKVADCILLFGYHKADVFPVDTWIKKVYQQYFINSTDTKQMRANLIGTYKNLSGYAQQYLFYFKRELKE
ncbi:MAG: DNA glycosylase [Clostridia bacterium]